MFQNTNTVYAIKLTQFFFKAIEGERAGKEVWVNPAYIAIINPVNAGVQKYTELWIGSNTLLVEETPEQIFKLIEGEK